MAQSYVWRGPNLNLKPPVIPEGVNTEFVAQVTAGATVVIVSADEEQGALVAFPPAPYCWRLPRKMWDFVHDEGEAEKAPPGEEGDLTPEKLLHILQHPNAVQIVTDLVEQRGPEAKAAVMPLLDPLMSALVPPDQLPAVRMALKMFIK